MSKMKSHSRADVNAKKIPNVISIISHFYQMLIAAEKAVKKSSKYPEVTKRAVDIHRKQGQFFTEIHRNLQKIKYI